MFLHRAHMGSTQLSLTPVQGDLTPSPELFRYCTHMVHIHTYRQNIHTHTVFRFLKANFISKLDYYNCVTSSRYTLGQWYLPWSHCQACSLRCHNCMSVLQQNGHPQAQIPPLFYSISHHKAWKKREQVNSVSRGENLLPPLAHMVACPCCPMNSKWGWDDLWQHCGQSSSTPTTCSTHQSFGTYLRKDLVTFKNNVGEGILKTVL